MEPVRIVTRYANGRTIKGFTNDFYPGKSSFHVKPVETTVTDKCVEVSVKELKAIFFVKDFAGDSSYNEKKVFSGGQSPPGRKVEVTFQDNEVLTGATLGYDPNRPGFFVTPADPQSNNLRIFVVSSAVSNVRYL